LTTLPPVELENKVFRIHGDSVTFTEVAEILGKTNDLNLVEKIPGDRADAQTFLMRQFARGAASSGWHEEDQRETEAAGSANHLWPNHKWRSAKQVLTGTD
jgi:hypothetical protein